MTGHTQQISEKDQATQPLDAPDQHLDVITVLRGEMYLLLDEDEILLKPTDTVILQGVNHG